MTNLDIEELDQAWRWKQKEERDAIIEEVIQAIPDRLEYYKEVATPNKLKNDWDMTKLKQHLRAHFKLGKENQ